MWNTCLGARRCDTNHPCFALIQVMLVEWGATWACKALTFNQAQSPGKRYTFSFPFSFLLLCSSSTNLERVAEVEQRALIWVFFFFNWFKKQFFELQFILKKTGPKWHRFSLFLFKTSTTQNTEFWPNKSF